VHAELAGDVLEGGVPPHGLLVCLGGRRTDPKTGLRVVATGSITRVSRGWRYTGAAREPAPSEETSLFRYALCNETFGDAPFADACRRIAAAGYEGVEIAPFTLAREFGKTADLLTPEERTALRRTAEDAGLRIAGLHWLLVPPPDGLHLTTPDAAVRARAGAYLAALAHLCADLGGTILVLGSPKGRNVAEGQDYAQARANFLGSIAPCLDACQGRGVTLCLEPLGPEETNFLTTQAEARDVIAAGGAHPACRTIFDVKAAVTEGRPLPEIIAEFAPQFAHVHANDANRRGPGFGEVDFVPILSALKSAGYEGWVSVEVFDYAPDPDTVARVSIETLRAAEAAVRS
jgi:sugar phosphate isomerase/epimerase